MNGIHRGYMEHSMIAKWAEEQAKTNAIIKATNDTIKKQHNEIITRGNKLTCKNMIRKLMGQVMAKMSINVMK
jgi:uncharacterized protein YacL (UPF0231 family)